MRQGEIWLVNLDPTVGAEIRKKRPCVILNDDSIGVLPLKVIAPITDFKKKFEIVPWMVKLVPDKVNNLGKVSVIDTFQVRAVARERLVKRTGEISREDLERALNALKIVFGMRS